MATAQNPPHLQQALRRNAGLRVEQPLPQVYRSRFPEECTATITRGSLELTAICRSRVAFRRHCQSETAAATVLPLERTDTSNRVTDSPAFLFREAAGVEPDISPENAQLADSENPSIAENAMIPKSLYSHCPKIALNSQNSNRRTSPLCARAL
jgi:hypothetical protein